MFTTRAWDPRYTGSHKLTTPAVIHRPKAIIFVSCQAKYTQQDCERLIQVHSATPFTRLPLARTSCTRLVTPILSLHCRRYLRLAQAIRRSKLISAQRPPSQILGADCRAPKIEFRTAVKSLPSYFCCLQGPKPQDDHGKSPEDVGTFWTLFRLKLLSSLFFCIILSVGAGRFTYPVCIALIPTHARQVCPPFCVI
jgi:hypothetical protein